MHIQEGNQNENISIIGVLTSDISRQTNQWIVNTDRDVKVAILNSALKDEVWVETMHRKVLRK